MYNILTDKHIEYARSLIEPEQLALVSIVGSHNYGTNTENSDIDLKIIYYPTFREFYKNRFNRHNHAGPDNDIDYTIHPLHEYIQHSLKGNISFFEVFFTQNVFHASPNVTHLSNLVRSAVEINYLKNYYSIRGMAHEKNKGVTNWMQKDDIPRAKKDAQHALRLLETLSYYRHFHKIELVLPDAYRKRYIEIRNNDFKYNDYNILYDEVKSLIDSYELYFNSLQNMSENKQALIDYIDMINRETYVQIRDRIIKGGY